MLHRYYRLGNNHDICPIIKSILHIINETLKYEARKVVEKELKKKRKKMQIIVKLSLFRLYLFMTIIFLPLRFYDRPYLSILLFFFLMSNFYRNETLSECLLSSLSLQKSPKSHRNGCNMIPLGR